MGRCIIRLRSTTYKKRSVRLEIQKRLFFYNNPQKKGMREKDRTRRKDVERVYRKDIRSPGTSLR